MLVVVTGASHVVYGSRGTGLMELVSRKMPKKNQVVVLLDPKRQYTQREGEVPIAGFLWYSDAQACSRNCFDRTNIARVMNVAARWRNGLPQCSDKLGLSLELGSFVAGVMISTTEFAQHTLNQVEPIRNFFAVLFLSSIGMLIHVHFLWTHVHILLSSVILVAVVKTTVAAGVTKAFG